MEPFFTFPKLPRLWVVALFTIVLLILLHIIAPQQVPVVLYKLCLVTLGGTTGYWIDRAMFPYARPHEQLGVDEWPQSMAALRRAIIVLACVLGLTLGL